MNEPMQQTLQAPRPASGAMIATLGLVALISGLLVVFVFETTQPMIEANKQALIERALFQVVPDGAVQRRDYLLTEGGVVEAPTGATTGIPFYAAYDADGKLKGIAAEGAAQGYADIIRVLWGYHPGCECITGNYVLKSAETPGLGDKIFKDEKFLANFYALDAKLDEAKEGLAHPIVAVKHGTKQNPWEIDAISGATVSSNAIGKALNDAASTLLPQLWPQLAAIEQVEPVASDEAAAPGGDDDTSGVPQEPTVTTTAPGTTGTVTDEVKQ